MLPRSLLKLAVLNATRKPSRTLLTAGIVLAGTALLVVSLSWIDGIFGGMLAEGTQQTGHIRVVDPDFAAREQLMPLYENLPDVEPLVAALKEHPEVTEAFPRIQTGVTITVGEDIGDVFGLAIGAPDGYFLGRMKLDDSLVEGRWMKPDAGELVMGIKLAREAGAKLGDEVVLLGMTQDGSISPIKGELVGIVQTGTGLPDRAAFVPLAQMQWLTDIPGGAIEILAYTSDHGLAAEKAPLIREIPALQGLTVQAWSERDPWAQMLPMVNGIWFAIVGCLVLLAALGVWNTMMMSVLERTDEIGVLRAMGMTRLGAVVLSVVEAAAIALIGGVLGVAIGAVPAYYLERNGLHLSEQVTENINANMPISSTMYADLSAEVVLGSLFLGVLMAVLGSLLPALRAALIQPVTAMRSGR